VLREVATIDLPRFPVSNVFLNGFVLPPPPGYSEAGQAPSFRVRINGCRWWIFPTCPSAISTAAWMPVRAAGPATRIEIELVGVKFTNFLAWFVG